MDTLLVGDFNNLFPGEVKALYKELKKRDFKTEFPFHRASYGKPNLEKGLEGYHHDLIAFRISKNSELEPHNYEVGGFNNSDHRKVSCDII